MELYLNSSSSTTTLSLESTSPATTPGSTSEDGGDGANDAAITKFSLDNEFSSTADAENIRYILVIGGLGFVGSHTSLELLKAGYSVIIVDNMSNSYASVLSRIKHLAAKHCGSEGRQTPALHFHKLDYRSEAMRFLLESYSDAVQMPSGALAHATGIAHRSRIAGVIHFAAYKSAVESIEKPLEYYENNVCGLVSLLRLLAMQNIRNFVFSSSATVYGTKANEGRLLREEDIVHHDEIYLDEAGNQVTATPMMAGLTSPYARSKFFSESILADVAHADPQWRIVALRYFNPVGCDSSGLLGESPRNVPTNLFPVITQVLTGTRPELHVFGRDWETEDGTAVRDFIHVSDVARGHVAALNAQADEPFRTYNLGSGTGTTVIQAVRSLELAAGKSIPIRWVGRRAGDVCFCVASRDRAEKELGWSPRESIANCARDLWNYVININEHRKIS